MVGGKNQMTTTGFGVTFQGVVTDGVLPTGHDAHKVRSKLTSI